MLRAALNLADRDGLESLSMRKLGQELGVEAMSLYNHVRNKDDILDGLVDLVFGELDLPAGGMDWRAPLRRRAISGRRVLLRHPWAVALMESRVQPGPAILRHHDWVLGSLRKAGFSVEAAAHAYSMLDAYVFGFMLQELSLPFNENKEVAEVAGTVLPESRADQYPYLAEMIVEHAMKPGYDYGDEFGFGLDLILDGVSRLKDSA